MTATERFWMRLLLSALLCMSHAAAAGKGGRYLAVFANGQRLEGDTLSGWHKHPASPRLDEAALLNAARPLRWLRDRALRPWRSTGDCPGYIEFVGGDRLIGQLAGVDPPDPGYTGPVPLRLRVRMVYSPDLSARLRRDVVRIFETSIRRVVWGNQPPRRFRPMTLFLRGGGRLGLISMRWTDDGVRALLDDGMRLVPFSQIAELHLRPADPWDTYCRELAILRAGGSSRLFRLETSTGLILTASNDRLRVISLDDKKPANWYHLVQPAWSADPICVPFETIRMRWHFAPHEVPLTRLMPGRVVQKSMTGYSWRWRRNRNAAGGRIVTGGKVAGWGLGVHAHNELVFKLPPSATWFRTRVGLDGSAGRGGCARALVYLNSTKDKPLYRSKVLIGSAAVHDTGNLPLASPGGADRSLILVADAAHDDRPDGADPLDIRDLLNWVEPVLHLDPAKLKADVARRVSAVVPAWQGWKVSVDGRNADPICSQWDTTRAGNARFVSAVATGGRRLTLTARLRIDRQRWLKLRVRQVGQPTNPGRVEVRADGRTIAYLPVRRAGLDHPYLIPVAAYKGKRIKLEVVYMPGAPGEKINWPALALVDRRTNANWSVLRTVDAVSLNGTVLTVQPDGSILAGGDRQRVSRGVDTYVIRAVTDLPRITAIRLEALTDSSLSGGGPGRMGGFILSQFRVGTLPLQRRVLRGRYVRVQLPRPRQVLSLAEVQVFAPPPPDKVLLERLTQAAPPANLVSPRHRMPDIVAIVRMPSPKRDAAQRALLRSYLDEISENIAPKGKASQSSTMERFKASLAIDGDVGHYFTHTAASDRPWWQLDLGAERAIDRIVIWNRIDFGLVGRLRNFDVTVLDSDRKVVWRQRDISDPPVPAVELFESDARNIALASAVESGAQTGRPTVGHALSSSGSGWTVASRTGEPHAAVFVLAEPVDARRTGLRFELKHAYEYYVRTLGRFRLLATGDDPPGGAEPVAVVVRPLAAQGSKQASAGPPPSPYPVFEDAGRFEPVASADRSKVSLIADDRHAGEWAVRIAPGGTYRLPLGRLVPIRSKPGEGEFRFIRFALRKYGRGQVTLGLEHIISKERSCRYEAGFGTPRDANARAVWGVELPEQWIVTDRDVFADFGNLDLTALTFSCTGGTYVVFDHIYLARSPEDFKRLPPAPSPELTNQKARRILARAVLEKGFPAVVSLRIGNRRATGVLVGDEGWILTAGHIAAGGGTNVKVRTQDGREYTARTAGVDRHTDLGLLKITDKKKGKWPGLKLSDARMLPPSRFYVGFSFTPTFKDGKIPLSYVAVISESGPRTVRISYLRSDLIVGGPLLDGEGRIAAVHHATVAPDTLEFSRAYVVGENWKRLTVGEIWGLWMTGTGPMLGIHIGGSRGGGCLVSRVYDRTPAVGKLRGGDIILKVGGQGAADLRDIGRALSQRNPGEHVIVLVKRGNRIFECKVGLMHRELLPRPTPPKPGK